MKFKNTRYNQQLERSQINKEGQKLLNNFNVIDIDGLEQRMMVNKFAVENDIPMVHVSAQYGYGYTFTRLNRSDPCLYCAFPDPPESRKDPLAVFGVATGIAVVMGAGKVIKIALHKGELARGYMLSSSVFQNDFYKLPVEKNPNCPVCGKL